MKLRCTEFDENGNVTVVDGEFKKSELIAKVMPVPQTLYSELGARMAEYGCGM